MNATEAIDVALIQTLLKRVDELERRQKQAIFSLESLANDIEFGDGEVQIFAADLTGIIAYLTDGEWPK